MTVDDWLREELAEYCDDPCLFTNRVNQLRTQILYRLFKRFLEQVKSMITGSRHHDKNCPDR